MVFSSRSTEPDALSSSVSRAPPCASDRGRIDWSRPWARRYPSVTMSRPMAPFSSSESRPVTTNDRDPAPAAAEMKAREHETGEERSTAGESFWSAAAVFLLAWTIYLAIYTGVFVLSRFSPWVAFRGAIANALPDALLALAAV